METKNYNEDNLKEDEIDSVVTRVKVYLINSNHEILAVHSNGGVQLPGGHVEPCEDYLDAVIREIREETGIELSSSEKCVPFFEINHYIKNYRNQGINRIAKMVYYYVFTNKPYTKEKIHLTTHEIESNFEIVSMTLKNFESELKDVEKNNSQEINRIISKETLASLEKLREILNI